MEASQRDRVRINVEWKIVGITWAERDWLLKKINVVRGYETIVAKFEAVGSSRPVELDRDELRRLRAPLEFWERDLTEGLARLLAAIAQTDPEGNLGTPYLG